MPDAADEIRAGIDAAHAAAERLVREASERAARVPPHGWDVPSESAPQGNPFPDLAALVGLLDAVRGSIPAELTVQLADALRELLVALRALIDWYIGRLESLASAVPSSPPEPRVQDIPID